MKLALQLGTWGAGPPDEAATEALIQLAEELPEFDSMWTAEAYGSDAVVPLTWWARTTDRLRLGTAIMQIGARTPAATAMTAMTLDHLTKGRFILGLGVSGPQVIEGWHGVPFESPLQTTREYVEILRRMIAREAPVEFAGNHYTLPHPGGRGLGKPLRSTVHPYRSDLPIYLGAEGPKNVALAAEICDGWIAFMFAPRQDAFYRTILQEGFERGGRRGFDDFEVVSFTQVAIGPDVEAAADQVRPHVALYVGGMGAKEANFHFDVCCRLGYQEEAEKVRELYQSGRKEEAIKAVPTALVEDIALVGPIDKVREDLALWEDSVVTTLLVSGTPETLRSLAAALR